MFFDKLVAYWKGDSSAQQCFCCRFSMIKLWILWLILSALCTRSTVFNLLGHLFVCHVPLLGWNLQGGWMVPCLFFLAVPLAMVPFPAALCGRNTSRVDTGCWWKKNGPPRHSIDESSLTWLEPHHKRWTISFVYLQNMDPFCLE